MDDKIIPSLNRLLNTTKEADSSAYEDALSFTTGDEEDGFSFHTPSEVSLVSTLNTTTMTGSGVFGTASLGSTAEVLITPNQLLQMESEIQQQQQQQQLNRTQTLRQRQLQRVKQEIEGFQDATGVKQHVRVPLESALPVQLGPAEEKEFFEDAQEPVEFAGSTAEPASPGPTEQQQVRVVDEKHDNYVLMYDMLTGIRTAVSRCQAKPSRPLTELDYRAYQKLAFDLTGSESTPQSRYDFKFKDYAPWVFRFIREGCGIDTADYLVSLTGKYVLSEVYSPGKSGSLFYYSQDYRFIIKTIRPSEHSFLLRILQHYHRHLQENPASLLVKFYGLHRVQLAGGGKKIYFVVMGNIFPPNRPLRSIYDLKGSTHGRLTEINENDCELAPPINVLKDLNWIDRRENLILGPVKATQLMSQLQQDCLFLTSLRIMDYSLLIGLHELSSLDAMNASSQLPHLQSKSPFTNDDCGYQATFADNRPAPEIYYLGIIDILTPYSLYKRLEHAFKSLVLPRDAISAVNPSVYARRFLKFMNRHILRDVNSDYSNRPLPSVPSDEL